MISSLHSPEQFAQRRNAWGKTLLLLAAMAALALSGFSAAVAAPGYAVLHSFNSYADGQTPANGSQLLAGSDGNFYGTTILGGTNGYGTVYKLTPGGVITTLHSFTDNSGDGKTPIGALVQDSSGNLYGVTENGGASEDGTIYKISMSGATYGVLYQFNPGLNDDAYNPLTGLTLSSGVLYGATSYGATSYDGAIFKINTDGSGYTTLFEPNNGNNTNTQGYIITTPLIVSGSTIYGASQQGGAQDSGAIFSLTTSGGNYQTLASFTYNYAAPGSCPSGLTLGADGNLYGVNFYSGKYNGGSIFSYSFATQKITDLHDFAGTPDGGNPDSSLTQDPSTGLFYGTTSTGGTNNRGVLFQISTSGAFQVLQQFTDVNETKTTPSGISPTFSGGTLYGVTSGGDEYSDNFGAAYKISPSSPSTFTNFFFFANGFGDGEFAEANLMVGTDGALHGTTYSRAAGERPQGTGTTFRMTTSGAYSQEYISTGVISSDLIQNSAGTYLGTSLSGGYYGEGSVFSYMSGDPGSGMDIESISGSAGIQPNAGLTIGLDGNYYGMCRSGGQHNDGDIFRLTPDGYYTILYSFTGGADGAFPTAGLVQDSAGNFYGYTTQLNTTSYGCVFKFSPSNQLTVLLPFDTTTVGYGSSGRLILSGNTLYGATSYAGASNYGTVYSVPTSGGAATVLHAFTNAATDGSYGGNGLTLGTDGQLYGVTSGGGASALGVVYSLSSNKTFNILHSFNYSATDGYQPGAGVTEAPDGNFYGTTLDGGISPVNEPGTNVQGIIYQVQTLLPIVTSLSAGSGTPGSSVTLTGVNLGNAISVAFNGTNGSITSDSATSVAATVPSGASSGPITVTTSNGVYTTSTSFTVVAGLSGVSFTPTSVVGGQANSTGTVTLSAPAPTGGATVTLTSGNANVVSVPSSVTVAAGATTATFTAATSAVTSSTAVMVTTAYNGVNQSATLTVNPPGPSLKSVTLSPTSTQGGSAATTANRVYLTGNATATTVVSLSSSNTAVATVPSTVMIQSGSSSHVFTITTKAVTGTQAVTITATYNGVTQTATLTVTPPPIALKSVTLSPISTEGGTSTTANRVYLTGNATATTTVSLTSSNTAVATVPSTVTIQQGSSSHVFTVTTKAVTSTQSVTITATSGGVSQTATLTVTP